jgi:hypothetical protein
VLLEPRCGMAERGRPANPDQALSIANRALYLFRGRLVGAYTGRRAPARMEAYVIITMRARPWCVTLLLADSRSDDGLPTGSPQGITALKTVRSHGLRPPPRIGRGFVIFDAGELAPPADRAAFFVPRACCTAIAVQTVLEALNRFISVRIGSFQHAAPRRVSRSALCALEGRWSVPALSSFQCVVRRDGLIRLSICRPCLPIMASSSSDRRANSSPDASSALYIFTVAAAKGCPAGC